MFSLKLITFEFKLRSDCMFYGETEVAVDSDFALVLFNLTVNKLN